MKRPLGAIVFSWAMVLLAVFLPRITAVPDAFAIGIWVAGLAVQGVIAVSHFRDGGTGTYTGGTTVRM